MTQVKGKEEPCSMADTRVAAVTLSLTRELRDGIQGFASGSATVTEGRKASVEGSQLIPDSESGRME